MSAALKGAVTPAQPRRQVTYIISELVKRMKEATDWLVSCFSFFSNQHCCLQKDVQRADRCLCFCSCTAACVNLEYGQCRPELRNIQEGVCTEFFQHVEVRSGRGSPKLFAKLFVAVCPSNLRQSMDTRHANCTPGPSMLEPSLKADLLVVAVQTVSEVPAAACAVLQATCHHHH